MTILNAPGINLPKIGAALFSLTPWPTITQEMSMLNQIGATTVRLEVLWSDVETTQGVYAVPDRTDGRIAAAKAAGMTVVIVLDYSNILYTTGVFNPPTTSGQLAAWSNYCAWVAGLYAGPNVFFEIWNEPNNPQFWAPAPSASQYAAVLTAAYNAIKGAVPSAQVIMGGVGDLASPGINATPFMQAVVPALGVGVAAGLAAHTLHPYNPGAPETLFPYVDAYRAGVPYPSPGPLMITEWGYDLQWLTGQANAPEIQRAYWAARMIGASIYYGLTGMCFYNLRDTGVDQTNQQNTFGLFTYALAPKAAVTAITKVMKALAGTVTYDAEHLADGVYRITLRKAAGAVVKLLWTDQPALTHTEPMNSISDLRDIMGAASGFNYSGGFLSIALSRDWPMQIVTGT